MNKVNTKPNPFIIEGLTSKTMFETLSDSADTIAIFTADMETGKSVWSDNAVIEYEFPDHYNDMVMEVWQKRIHPDDLEDYVADINAIFSGQKTSHVFQYRVRNKYGEYNWVECKGFVARDNESHKKFFIGYIFRLDRVGIYDSLTGCQNLGRFYHSDFENITTIGVIGIDSFRKVINRIGFHESNEILKLLGNLLIKRLSKETVYRMTGDEFLVVSDSTNYDDLRKQHEVTLNMFINEVEKQYPGMIVKYSAAVTFYDAAKDTKDDLIHRLEHTLEYAKQHDTGSLAFYDTAIEESHIRNAKIQEALNRSIENQCEGFRLVYQPVMQLNTNKINGAEALLRFDDKELGTISPTEFIPILEKNGGIKEVGLWVAEQTIRQKAIWDQVKPGVILGFNASMLQLRDQKLSNRVVELIRQYNIEPSEIIVELTESQKMEDPESLRNALKPLTDHNIGIALDDFGMEASTFTLVQELPVNRIKVDHSFVRTMVGSGSQRKDKANIAIVSSINHLAQQLGLIMIVEGVENKEIHELLKQMGIQYAQGYYYSKPITVKELETNYLQTN